MYISQVNLILVFTDCILTHQIHVPIYRNQQRQATLVLMLFILQTLGLVVHLDATGYSRIQGDHSRIVIATQGSNALLIR